MASPSDWHSGPTDGTTAQRKRVSFDPTINLGHVLTAAAMLATGFAAWSALDKRITTVEVESKIVREAQSARDGEQDLRLRESVVTIKESIQRVERVIDNTRK